MSAKKESFKVKVNESEEQTIRIVNEGYYLFFNCQHLLIQLKPLARSFFDFLCEKMRSDNNEIIVDAGLKTAFRDHINSITGGKQNASIGVLDKHLKVFKELGLLLHSGNSKKELYTINPKYAYKGGKGNRIKLLRVLIEERLFTQQDLKGLIDQPKNNFSN